MCKHMQLDSQAAVISYKLSSDRAKDAVREISTEEDYVLAMDSILKKTRNARMKAYTLILHNLVSVRFPTSKSHLNDNDYGQNPNQYTAASKRKSCHDNDRASEAQLIERYVNDLRSKLQCERHGGFCLIRGSNSNVAKHEELDDTALSYWARMIVGSNQTYVCRR
jgi:hypothetical protein